MTTSELITDYKNKLALKLVNTEGLVEAMGNDDIEEPDEAIYTYIFPYFHIPDTIEAAHSYICFKVNIKQLTKQTKRMTQPPMKIKQSKRLLQLLLVLVWAQLRVWQ